MQSVGINKFSKVRASLLKFFNASVCRPTIIRWFYDITAKYLVAKGQSSNAQPTTNFARRFLEFYHPIQKVLFVALRKHQSHLPNNSVWSKYVQHALVKAAKRQRKEAAQRGSAKPITQAAAQQTDPTTKFV